MRPQFPLECTCSHQYEPFQLTFARHALQRLPPSEEGVSEAAHRGLVLRGETESALQRPIEILRDYYGSQIRFGSMTVCYHRGLSLEEPHMVVRVMLPMGHFDAVKDDLLGRRAVILEAEQTTPFGLIRATAPLAQLLGYGQSLSELTSGRACVVMWLSHYAPVESPPPGGRAA
jgi:hypothetical protein